MVESCAEKTYAATTITDIVSRAHISRTTFYKHFEDKRACFDAAIDYCIGELQGVAATAHSPSDPPGDAARKAATAVVEALAAKPGLAQLLTGDAMAVEPLVIERYRGRTIPALEALWSENGAGQGPHRPPPRLRPGPGPDPQPDRHRQAGPAARSCCRRSSTWPSAPSAATRRR